MPNFLELDCERLLYEPYGCYPRELGLDEVMTSHQTIVFPELLPHYLIRRLSVGEFLFLTPWAIMCPSTCTAGLFYYLSAAAAGFALLAKDL